MGNFFKQSVSNCQRLTGRGKIGLRQDSSPAVTVVFSSAFLTLGDTQDLSNKQYGSFYHIHPHTILLKCGTRVALLL